METTVDYGPLQALIGTWQGANGLDKAPEPDGFEENPYYETIEFSPIGDLKNAEIQVLSALFYRQIVRRKSNDEVFHDETGYWIWDAAGQTVIHSLTIPRGVSVLAGASHTGTIKNDEAELNVKAHINDPIWGILQQPFMQAKARTTRFEHSITVKNGKLNYKETTWVEIYGKTFEHTDENTLQKI